MNFPAGLKYSEQHEWVRVEGDEAVIGITDFAQDSLGDVVHVELPQVGNELSAGGNAAEVESVKAVSDVYAPVGGEVLAVNEDLDGNEDRINKDPYGEGWLFRVRFSDPADLDKLMDVAAYEAFAAQAHH